MRCGAVPPTSFPTVIFKGEQRRDVIKINSTGRRSRRDKNTLLKIRTLRSIRGEGSGSGPSMAPALAESASAVPMSTTVRSGCSGNWVKTTPFFSY